MLLNYLISLVKIFQPTHPQPNHFLCKWLTCNCHGAVWNIWAQSCWDWSWCAWFRHPAAYITWHPGSCTFTCISHTQSTHIQAPTIKCFQDILLISPFYRVGKTFLILMGAESQILFLQSHLSRDVMVEKPKMGFGRQNTALRTQVFAPGLCMDGYKSKKLMEKLRTTLFFTSIPTWFGWITTWYTSLYTQRCKNRSIYKAKKALKIVTKKQSLVTTLFLAGSAVLCVSCDVTHLRHKSLTDTCRNSLSHSVFCSLIGGPGISMMTTAGGSEGGTTSCSRLVLIKVAMYCLCFVHKWATHNEPPKPK